MKTFNLVKSLTTLVSNITSLPFREGLGLGSLRLLILCLSLATFGVESAWAWRGARVKVYSEPSNGGWVWVTKTSGNAPSSWEKTEDESEQSNLKVSDQTWTFYMYANPKTNYQFKGWATSRETNTISYSGQTNQAVSAKGTKSASYNEYFYYAIFARMTTDVSSVAFGAKNVDADNTATVKLTIVHAGNVNISLIDNNSTYFSIDGGGQYSSVQNEETKTITVHYLPKAAGSHSATLQITSNNGLSTITIPLTGSAKSKAEMSWNPNTDILNKDETLSSSALTYSDLTRDIIFTSSNEDVIAIIDNVPTAKDVGKATITATQAETAEFYKTSASQEITVTNKQKQLIKWDDKLSFKYEGSPFTQELSASANTAITYSLSNVTNSCVSLSSNVLTIKNYGTAYVTATANETDEYVGVSMTRKVIVRDPNAACETIIYGPTAEHEFDLGWNAASHQTKTQEIDFGGLEPRYVNFDYKGKAHKVLINYYEGTLRIDQYVNGGWQEVKNLGQPTMNGSYVNTGNIALDRKATKMRVRAEDGMGYMYFKDCVVTLAKYLEISTNALSFDAQVGISSTKTFNVNYSDVQGPIEITSSNSDIFTFSPSSFDADCEQHGTKQITVTLNSNKEINAISETITISNGVEPALTINVSGKVTKRKQDITWESQTTYNSTDKPTLSATATSGLAISSYSSSNESIAKVVNSNQLEFYGSGDVSITVKQNGNDYYEPTEFTQKITVSKVTPAISTNPTATITYGQQLNTVSLSGGAAKVNPFRGQATDHAVEGSFSWTNGGYTVIETGGTTHEYDVTFTPSGTEAGMYNSVQGKATVTVNKATPILEVTNPKATKIYIDDTLTPKINLVSCIKSYSAESDPHGHTQNKAAITYSCEQTDAVISNGNFWATAADTFTVTATAPATEYYNEVSNTITIVVGKHTPVITWKTFEHIYAGDTLVDVASTSFLGSPVDLELTYENVSGSFAVEGNKLLIGKQYTEKHNATVRVTTTETDYYAQTSSDTTYLLEVKKLPKFYLNDVEMSTETENNLTLKVGETANVSFEQIEESAFTYTKNAQFVTYAHDSENHTGVITAIASGDEGFQFHQAGTTTVFDRICQMHIWVNKHADTLNSPIHDNDIWMVDSVYTGEMYTIKDDGYTGNAQETVIVESNNESIIRHQQDGSWKAVGEGTATITIKQINNAYWTGDTITRVIKVQKHTPVITWNIDGSSYAWGSVINNPVSSTNTDVPFTITSNNPSVANYVNGRIEVYNTTGTVTFTLAQEGNDKWNAATTNLTKSFSTFQPANHVPFTLTNDNNSNFYSSNSGTYTWSNGYKIGNGGINTFNKNTSSVTIRFTGVPDKLSFTKTLSKAAGLLPGDGDCNCYVYESADGSSWSQCYFDKERKETKSASNIQLQPTTRYLKFEYKESCVYCTYSNITVTERSSIEPVANSLDFGTGYNGNTATKRSVDVNWFSVMPCTVAISGTDASQFYLSDDSKTIASSLDNSGSTTLSVFYTHEENKTHSATLTITSGDTPAKTATIQLTGTTERAPQEIIWREDITPLPHDGGIYEGAALASSGGEVVLTSDDENVVKVVGNGLQPVGVGKTTVHAYQAGDDIKWQPVNATKEIEVTSLSVQHLIWNDQLNNIKRSEGNNVNITLTAQSDAIASDPSLVVTYELDDAAKAFASISGNQLTITGWGSGYITAKQVGNANYIATQKVKPIISRNPDADCKMLAGEYWDEYTLHTIASKEIDILNGEPATIEFDAKMDAIAIGEGLHLDEWYDNSWHEFKYIDWDVMAKNLGNYAHYGPYNLNRKSTKVRLYTNTGATMTRTFKNVEITLIRYLELAQNDISFAGVDKGAFLDQTFYINYSNLRGTLDVELKNASSNLQVMTETVGEECGEIGKMVPVTIRCTGNVCGTENNVIVLSNKEQKLEVPISATIVPPSQNITWNPQTNILTTDNVELNASCTSNLPISYSSNNTDVATVQQDGEGVWSMTIIKNGMVTITASQAGSTDWSPAPDKNVVFTISKATPVVTTWATPSEVVKWTTLANTPLTGGEASVPGTFSWQDGTKQVERGNSGYTMVFTPTNTNWYNTVTNTVVVPVSKDPQTITWNYTPQPIYCNAQLTFDATASSGLKVRYESSDPSIAYVNENNLAIISGGNVTITAIQDGDDTWAYASLSKEIEILRWTPVIETLPTANSMLIGQLLDNATLTGGVAVVNEKPVDGSFAWKEGSTTTIDIAGTATRTVIFTPSNPNHYNSTTCEVSVEVNKYAPEITHNLTASTITYGQALSASTLSGTLTAMDKVKQPNEAVEGTFGWLDQTLVLNAGQQKAIVRFSPTNSDWYNYVDIEIPIQVNKATANATPSAAAIEYGKKVSESNLTNVGTTPGTWTWTDNKKEDILPVGVHDHLSVHFVPTDNANYLEADGEVSLTVNKATPTLTWTEKANAANALGQKTFTASSTNTDANAVITYSITSGTDCATIDATTGVVTMIKKGSITITASQAATENFTAANAISATCEISPAPTHIVTLPTINDGTPIEIGTQLNGLVLTGGEVQNTINNNGVEGTFAITGGNIFTVGATSITITFTPNNTEVYAGCSTNAEVTIHADDYYQFTGNENTSWTNGSNWDGTKGTPSSDEDAKVIIVSGTLDITSNENVNVTDLTILPTGTVHVHGDLSVNGTTIEGGTYGDLFVHNGGIATIGNDARLTVNNFVIESSIGTEGQSASGQVHNESNIIYTTGAYIDINMDPSGKMDDTQWYGFTVPFPVDVQNGVARKEGDIFRKCTYGSDYMIAEYDMNQRLNTGKGWKYIKSGKLQPGQFYYITVNGDYNVYSFKAAENTITINNTAELKVNGEGADANWNAVGNSTLTYTTISGEKIPNYVQTYLNGKSQYMTVATSEAQFVVGCPFFFQASDTATMILNEANGTVDAHYAPRQESLDKPVCVRIAEEGKHFSDQIYLTASQEATGEYTLGRDLAKAGIGTKSAQLWMNAYGQKLSVQDATLMGDQAYYELSIYAPKAGSYELSLPKVSANAVIYLTQDGYPIWNLNETPYVIECYKGTTNEFGLLLRLQEGGSPTDMQTMRSSEKVQKIMKDQRIYINANSQLYDLMGQKVK